MRYMKALWLFGVVGIQMLNPHIGLSNGQLVVYAVNTLSSNAPPPETTLWLNGAEIENYQNQNWITLEDLPAGSHTVEVHSAASGFLPRECMDEPNATENPYSTFGNPRIVHVSEEASIVDFFRFDPVITVQATVRDGWTMERLEGVHLSFISQGEGEPHTLQNYPWGASYAPLWESDVNGDFPSNTLLYVNEYDLQLEHEHYESYTWTHAIQQAQAGDIHELGTLLLYPIDENQNGIGDAWEAQFFNGETCLPKEDSDFDGMSNYAEYIAGTDPTQASSCLVASSVLTNGTFELTWTTSADRTYCISGTTNLCVSNSWQQVGGPWETSEEAQKMTWVETNQHLSYQNSYRIDVVPFWWDEPNTVLINTNRTQTTYPGGSPTNSLPPGSLPPVPGG